MTPESEPKKEKQRKISAVGAIIMFSDGRILIAKETQDKPEIDKKAGDWGFPVETLKEGESFNDGLKRLIEEEVGSLEYFFDPKRDWVGDYGIESLGKTIWERVFVLHAKASSLEANNLASVDNEVIDHRWVFPKSLQSLPRRSGVWEPLKDFTSGQRGVICQKCSPGVRF